MLVAGAIVAAEVGFWLCLFLGLLLRYRMGFKILGLALLVLTPLIDIALLLFSYLDLRGGAQPTFFHGMAAAYIGFSLVFGPEIIRSLDHKYAGTTPAPAKGGLKQDMVKASVAAGIASAIIVAGIVMVGLEQSFWLTYWLIALIFTPLMWFGLSKWQTRKSRERAPIAVDAH